MASTLSLLHPTNTDHGTSVKTKKDKDVVEVYTPESFQPTLEEADLLLFALLTGGDYGVSEAVVDFALDADYYPAGHSWLRRDNRSGSRTFRLWKDSYVCCR